MSDELVEIKVKDLRFMVRKGSSDFKSIEEVVLKSNYEKHGIEIKRGSTWIDLGANIGAFTVLALSKGAKVIAVEPDPDSLSLLEQNIKINFPKKKVKIIPKAIVADQKKQAFLYLNTEHKNYWRNSIEKMWTGGKVVVPCINFKEVFAEDGAKFNVKMDIEGSEMAILENLFDVENIDQLVFEYSFDVDPSLGRFRAIIRQLKTKFLIVKYNWSSTLEVASFWQPNWFPPLKMVYCRKKGLL